jgi:uncharacterized protein YjcR
MPKRIQIEKNELRRLYEDKGLGIVAIAERYGCSPTTISNRLRECGISVRSSRFQSCHISADELRHLYETERLPLHEIATRLGVSISTIHKHRNALGIPPRPRTPVADTTPTNSEDVV